MLSNLDLVTESLTLIAGKRSRFSFAIWYRRWTPVVVSSVTPLMSFATCEYQPGFLFLMALKSATSSSLLGAERTEGSFRSEEHTSELQSRLHLVCRLLLEKKKYTSRCPTSGSPSDALGVQHYP